MNGVAVQSMGNPHYSLGDRLAAFLRPMSLVDVQSAASCHLKTAENMKQGHWPQARHWAALVATFGRDITDAVFHPHEAIERLEREAREYDAKAAEKRAAARNLASTLPRGSSPSSEDCGVRPR